MKKRFFSILTAFMLAAAFVPSPGAYAADDTIQKNMEDGSFYEGWNRDGAGTFTLQEQPDGSLNTAWDAVKESVIRYGTGLGKDRTVSVQDKLQVSYEAEIGGEGIYYFGVSGYLKNPSCEFYVIEGWNAWQPPGKKDVLKTVEIDGVQYDLYQTTGESWADLDHFTYPVFWSVRHENLFREGQTNVCAGTVSLDAHFRAWYSLDPTEIMGASLPEICAEADAFGLEAQPASGTCKIAKPVFTFAQSDDAESTGTVKAGTENIIYQQGFETDLGLWKRATFGGGTKLSTDRNHAAEGLCSMRASTDGGYHCGAELSLVPYSMKTDKTYYVQAVVLQNSFETADFRVECGFDARKGSGVRWSGGISSGINQVKKGEWTVIRFAFCPDESFPSDDAEKQCGDADIRLSFYLYDYARIDEIGCYPLEERAHEFWLDSVTVSESDYPPMPDLSGAFREETACTGDANCDGTVDVADAVLIMRYAVEDREAVITDQGKANSDTDGDGKISSEDAKQILLYVAKKISAFDASSGSVSNEQSDPL